ncbi:MAG: 16S rRNA (adenine(1518)-N(6)/adenine(1519)-N(6))-dimethyltransferase RsmA [Aggregatilineales bacterium]
MSNPKALLEEYEIDPKRALGQNFLHDPNMLEKIVETGEVTKNDIVIEIGPGTGALTHVLAQNAKHVYCIEIDMRLQTLLENELAPYDNVSIIWADVLKTNIAELVGESPYLLVANVPYYITSAIIKHFLEDSPRPQRVVMTIQYELAERITATPNNMSLLAVSVQYFGSPEIITRMKPAVFWPRPEIDSAVLKIDVFDQPPVEVSSDKAFFRVVRAGFSQKRKQLRNSLGGGLGIKAKESGALIEQAGIDPQRRAETLTIAEWGALARLADELSE